MLFFVRFDVTQPANVSNPEAWPIYDYRSFADALNEGTHGG